MREFVATSEKNIQSYVTAISAGENLPAHIGEVGLTTCIIDHSAPLLLHFWSSKSWKYGLPLRFPTLDAQHQKNATDL
ncbi:MAG: hypothetical protein WC007_00805 [Pelobacteraceae bacterium]